MQFLFFFLDGVGLGANDPTKNPFAAVELPNLEELLGGQRLLLETTVDSVTNNRATFLSLDACLGVEGRPQSATGQATLLTGKNVPAMIGQHYGPKPNKEIRTIVSNGNIFSKLKNHGLSTSFLNAFPKGYFDAIDSGRRLPGAVAMAARSAGIPLKSQKDLWDGNALSADFTAQGWQDHLKLPDTPVISAEEAGERLNRLTNQNDFCFFEYWLSDYTGHKRDMQTAATILKTFDQVLGGLLASWDDDQGLILITSDHGNLEDLSVRNHTRNPVPAILIGSQKMRDRFTQDLKDLSDIFPAILSLFDIH